MDDRYLFRAKRKYNGEWVEGCLVIDESRENEYKYRIKRIESSQRHAYPSTICQCTGLNKFFEKDIVKRTDIHEVGEPSVGIIEYDAENTEFVIHWIDKEIYSPMYPWKDKIKVIGNIFDNPELLEQED